MSWKSLQTTTLCPRVPGAMPASSLWGDEGPSLGGSFLFSDHFRTVCVQNEALHNCREHHVSSRLQEKRYSWRAGIVAPDTPGCMVWVHNPQSSIVLKPGLLEHSRPPCSGGTRERRSLCLSSWPRPSFGTEDSFSDSLLSYRTLPLGKGI